MKRLCIWILGLVLIMVGMPGLTTNQAQEDGLNLPSELYILLNEGRIERYGIGAEGVQTITTPDNFVLDFSIAPDNNWLSYRTEDGLKLANMSSPDEVRTLEGASADFPAVRGRGETLAWANDGSALAYTTSYGARVAFNTGQADPAFVDIAIEPLVSLSWSPFGSYLAAEAQNDVWWIFRREGIQMSLVAAIPGARGTAWLADPWLIFGPPEGGLRLMDLSAANTQTILQDESRYYYLPAVTDSGEIVVFSRDADDTTLAANAGYLQRLTIQGAQVFEVERSEFDIDLTGLRWAPGAEIAISFREGVLALILPQSGLAFPLPIEDIVAYGWGAPRPPAISGLNMSRDLYFRAPDLNGITQVWRLPDDGQPAQPLTQASANVTAYHLGNSPAQPMTYISGGQLYQQPLTGGEASPIITLPEGVSEYSINTNGGTLAFATANSGDDSPSGVWYAAADGSVEAQLVLVNSGAATRYSNPRFAPNSDALLARLQVEGSVSTVMLDPATGEVVMLGSYSQAFWTPEGSVIAYGGEQSTEVYLIDPTLRPIQPLLLMRSAARIQSLRQLDESRLSVAVSADNPLGPALVSLVEVMIGVGEADDVATPGFMLQPSISPDGSVVAGLTREGGNMLVFDVNQQQLQVIDGLSGIEDLQWSPFIR